VPNWLLFFFSLFFSSLLYFPSLLVGHIPPRRTSRSLCSPVVLKRKVDDLFTHIE
jgi:hypothetical protein